jgi:glutamate synthase (NADPH/NADH) large chain
MVELEAITEEDDALEKTNHQGGDMETHGQIDILKDMTKHDAIRLKTIVQKHAHYTNSEVAKLILEKWDKYLPKFVKVMPVDYRKALEKTSFKNQQSNNSISQL